MPTTSNFGWTTPADTDLVKDGAAAIRTLGNGIDTSLVDLKGGTTGQVLAKASNTDLDFTWSSSSGISATIFDAKGDIIAASAADTAARLAVGTNGQLLSANSSTATGLEWVAAPTAGANWSLLNSGGTALSGVQEVTISSISGKDKILILVEGASTDTSNRSLQVRLNGDSNSNYYRYGPSIYGNATYDPAYFSYLSGATTQINLFTFSTNVASVGAGYVLLSGCNSSGVKAFNSAGGADAPSASAENVAYTLGGYYNSASTISSVTVRTSSGLFDAGTVYVYASA